MAFDLLGWLALAAVWLVAALVADGLPATTSPAALRRRATGLLALVLIGLAGLAAAFGWGLTSSNPDDGAGALRAAALATAPALVVAVMTVPRLRRIRTGAGALATAAAPNPPGLLAEAAHPMAALPVLVTGVALLPAVARATGAATVAAGSTGGLMLTGIVVALVAAGVRHALRHSQLAERAVTGRALSPAAPVRSGPTTR
ncbi:hypothetical protein ACN27F_18880 [Solwaraspora sp. WMMB335]|uniref:hypothetical protein n=1 Tax=Solwaraspora sp. WMMB335 TaxID=3404118 RepID=UPI003B963ABA